MDDQQKWCVYMHINKINHKKYVGITSTSLTKRWWKNGGGYKNNPHFYRAIQEYGWDNFEHLIYQRVATKEAAGAIERQLILLFETQNPDKGYNISGGGEYGHYIDGRHSDPNYHKNMQMKYRKNETPEQREHRLAHLKEYKQKRRQNETPEQREERLVKARERSKEYRQNLTPEQREEKLAKCRERDRKRRQNLTPEQRKKRSEYLKKYKKEHREELLAKRKEYEKEHREEIREYMRGYHKKKKEEASI